MLQSQTNASNQRNNNHFNPIWKCNEPSHRRYKVLAYRDQCRDDKQILVSAVITTFNSEGTLNRLFSSLINQTFPLMNVELIIVDGGSTDSTMNIIKKFINNYGQLFCAVKFIGHPKNYGLSAARNDGICNSRGKHILVLDHDVILNKDTIETLYNYLEKAPKNVACVRPLRRHVYDTLVKLRKMFEKLAEDRLVKVSSIADCTLCRREVFEAVGLYDETMGPPFTIYEDLELGARVLRAGWEIHMIGWHSVVHDTRDTRQNSSVNDNTDILHKLISILQAPLDKQYRYALRKYLASSPIFERARWRTYQVLLLSILFMIPLAFCFPLVLIVPLSLFIFLWLDVMRKYWNPRMPHYVAVYGMVTLVWRIIRSLALFLPSTNSRSQIKYDST